MQKILENVFDSYARKARLYPAFLALMPIFAVMAAYTNWLELEFKHAIWAAIAAAALFFLADFTRQRGKAVEKKLIKDWGVFPSVSLLRHRDKALDPYTTAAYHNAAALLLPDISMPTVEEEEADPDDADNKYQAVTTALLPRTRDTEKFSLIFKENVNYGFRRNMLGIKPIAIVVVLGCIAFCAAQGWSFISNYALPKERESFLIVAGSIVLLAWMFGVTKDAVEGVAKDYARHLLMAVQHLD